jgi:Zn-dependent M28 family amino/carboxypeptidase
VTDLRAATTAVALLLVLGSCQPAPSTAPSGAPSSIGAAPTTGNGTAAPIGSPGAGGVLAGALRDAISADDILADLGRLDAIAAANGGNRAAGSAGYDQSVALVAGELRAAGYDVRLEPTQLTAFRQDAPSVLQVQAPGATALADIRDFKAMLLSPSGDVTADLFALGFDPTAQPGARNGIGCDPADWSIVPAGVIALVQPGGCRRRDVVLNAQAAGVVGLITSYAEWTPDHVLRPTLIDAAGLSIPVVGVAGTAGLALLAAAQAGSKVHLGVHTTVESTQSPNLIADLPGGDAAHVVMIGGHLDSVVDGPGINDNGSGTMSILEIARELAKLRPSGPAWHVRVAFWTGEEIGLLGSFAYVGGLSAEDASTIEAYLNFDMVGSPNGVREIYDTAASSRPIAGEVIEGLLAQALGDAGLASEVVDIGGASDHLPFEQIGIPMGGLFSGANEVKSDEQAGLFGGTAGLPNDACYHLACDTAANIDRELLEQLARAAAWTLGRFADGEVMLPEG